MPQLDANSKLLKLCQQQYRESAAYIGPRLARWRYLIDQWRGIFRDEAYYKNENREKWFSGAPSVGNDSNDDYLWDDDLRFYVRELFKHIETFLTRLDRAFTANPRPFQLAVPRITTRPLMPQDYLKRIVELSGATNWLCTDYQNQGISEEQIAALRDACMVDVGWTIQQRGPGPMPHGTIRRIEPWYAFPDPFKRTAEEFRYFIHRVPMSEGEACERWPDDAEDIRRTGTKSTNDGSGRREVTVLHYYGFYDPAAMEAAMDDWELQDLGPNKRLFELWFLDSGESAGPSDLCLEAYPVPFNLKSIPVQQYTIIRDPEERGPLGLALASLIVDGQEAVNILYNRALQAFEYSVLQGGFYDSALAHHLDGQLVKTPRPGEWRGIAAPMGQLSSGFYALKYPQVTSQYLELIQSAKLEDARLSAVQDSNVGLSTPTQTNTLGEVTLLSNESNETFRFRAQRLDAAFRRSYQLHVQISADALKTWMDENGQQLFFMDPNNGQYTPIDPTTFDEPWEVEMRSGSTLVDGPRKAQKLLAYAQLAASGQVPPPLLRQAMTLDQLDPDQVLGPPPPPLPPAAMMPPGASPSAEAAPAAIPPPVAVPPNPLQGGVQPGLSTRAALAGQAVTP